MADPHPQCVEGHVCQQPSGQPCIEAGCDVPAGTWWGPLWCPTHDVERLSRVGRQLSDLHAALDRPMADLLQRTNAALATLSPSDPLFELLADLMCEVTHLRRDLADCRRRHDGRV